MSNQHIEDDPHEWTLNPDGTVQPRRRAEFWRRVKGQNITCDLCYRRCEIEPGLSGWCRTRRNDHGKMRLTAHGVISCAVKQMLGYQFDPFLTYKPGALSLFLGATYCTAGCTFCMSKEITWQPDKVDWAWGEGQVAKGEGWYGRKALLHPTAAVWLAKELGCTQIGFGINEPTLTLEYTVDVARLARRAGLDVLIETNGLSTPQAIGRLAPYVSAVDLGIKGSGDPEFYRKWMRSPDAMPAVLASARAWREAGVHLVIGDVIAPPQMQSAEVATEAQRRLYGWLAAELGPMTLALITSMMVPGAQEEAIEQNRLSGFLLSGNATEEEWRAYLDRVYEARAIAQEAGLPYAHMKTDDEVITCHACGGLLLRFTSPMSTCRPCILPTHFCPWWTHKQFVTDGRCDHCGVAVPIVTLAKAELQKAQRIVAEKSGGAKLEQTRAVPLARYTPSGGIDRTGK